MLKYSAKKYQSPLNSGLWANSRTAYRTAWQNLFKGEKQVPVWVRQARGTSSPYVRVRIAGKHYISGEMCKPHDCGNHRFYGVFSEDKKRAWGLLVTVKDTDNAMVHPNQVLTDRLLCKPDHPSKAQLIGRLRMYPNWK